MIRQFVEYSRTEDFARGVFVNLCATGIELLVLSVMIPVIVYFVRRIRTRRIRFEVNFYLFQVFHKIARMFLDLASVSDPMPILTAELEKNPKFEIYSHFAYGNLENILFVLRKVQSDSETYVKEIESKSVEDFLRYAGVCDKCVEEIDRLTAMVGILPKVQEDLFEMRMLVYPLRDMMEGVAEVIRKSEKKPYRRQLHIDDVKNMTHALTIAMGEIFSKRRRLVDSMIRYRECREVLHSVLSVPYVLLRRVIMVWYCRVRGTPYRDSIAPSPVPDILREWRERQQWSPEQAAETLGIPIQEYKDYENGYRQPTMVMWEKFKPEIRKTTGITEPLIR